MKLRTDPEARFVRHSASCAVKVDSFADAQGVVFRCPCDNHVLLLWFADKGVPDEAEPVHRWAVTGTDLKDLKLTPSTKACWHDFLQSGGCA